MLTLQKYYIKDITKEESPRVPLELDFYGGSIREIFERADNYEDLDTHELCNFLGLLFLYRTGVEDKYHVFATFNNNKKESPYIEFCIFSIDAGNGAYQVGATRSLDIDIMEKQGLIIRKEIKLPANFKKISIESIEEDLSKCNYYLSKNRKYIEIPKW